MISDAQAKLRRANEHISEVERLIRSYLATDFYRLSFEPDHGEGRIKVVFQSLHQPDKSIALAVGDAVSNMRSALDYAVVALTGLNKAAMPVADSAKGFKGELKSALVVNLGLDAVAFFISKIQAYENGVGHAVWQLNKLRNIDKHRFLLTTINVAGVTASWRDRSGSTFTDCSMMVQAGNGGTFIAAPANYIQFTGNPRPAFQVSLAEPPYFPNAPLIDTLKRLHSSTGACVNSMRDFPLNSLRP